MFVFSAGCRSVGVSRHSGRRRSVLEAQRAADGRRQDHAQDDAADDDHDLLLQGDRRDAQVGKDRTTEQSSSYNLTVVS